MPVASSVVGPENDLLGFLAVAHSPDVGRHGVEGVGIVDGVQELTEQLFHSGGGVQVNCKKKNSFLIADEIYRL